MTDDYAKYERKCNQIIKRNKKLISYFEEELLKRGLSRKTVDRHIVNVELYINDYLLRTDAQPMEEGLNEINAYLGWYVIEKFIPVSPNLIRSFAASLKKFYKCMAEAGEIEKESCDEFCRFIKDNMECWAEYCNQYNNPDAPSPFMC